MSREALNAAQIKEKLADLPGWTVNNNALERVIEGESYLQALDWLYAIGQLAERENHHPDMCLHYKTLTIRFWTHTAGGITPLDVEMAGKVDGLAG